MNTEDQIKVWVVGGHVNAEDQKKYYHTWDIIAITDNVECADDAMTNSRHFRFSMNLNEVLPETPCVAEDFLEFKDKPRNTVLSDAGMVKLITWLGITGITFFKNVKTNQGSVDAIFVDRGFIHIVHHEEGMQVRNFLRDLDECKDWDCHKLDDTWVQIIEELLELVDERARGKMVETIRKSHSSDSAYKHMLDLIASDVSQKFGISSDVKEYIRNWTP